MTKHAYSQHIRYTKTCVVKFSLTCVMQIQLVCLTTVICMCIIAHPWQMANASYVVDLSNLPYRPLVVSILNCTSCAIQMSHLSPLATYPFS